MVCVLICLRVRRQETLSVTLGTGCLPQLGARLEASEPPQSPIISQPCFSTSVKTALYVGARDLNSGPHASSVSSLTHRITSLASCILHQLKYTNLFPPTSFPPSLTFLQCIWYFIGSSHILWYICLYGPTRKSLINRISQWKGRKLADRCLHIGNKKTVPLTLSPKPPVFRDCGAGSWAQVLNYGDSWQPHNQTYCIVHLPSA